MKIYTIGEIILENPKSKIKVKESGNTGKYVFFTSGEKRKFYNDFLCDGKNIFIATGGKAYFSYYDGKASYSTDCYSIKTKTFVHTKFLFYFLQLKIAEIDRDMFKGAALKHLQKNQFKKMKINIPSLDIQNKIVSTIDLLFEEINQKKLINLEKINYVELLLKSILDNKMGKKVIKLIDACDLIKRGIAPKYLESGGLRVINQKCIRNHKIDYSKTRRHDNSFKKVPNERLIKKGDVLVNSTGHGTLGRVAQVKDDPSEKTTVDTHVTIIRPKKNLFDFSFFGNALIKIEKQLELAAEGTSGQTELPRKKLESEFSIAYIESIEQQKKISKLINSMFDFSYDLKKFTTEIINNLVILKSSVLKNEYNDKL